MSRLPDTLPLAPSLAGQAYRDNLRGAGIMVLSMAAFTTNDATMKYVTQTLPLMQAITLRGAAIVAILLLVAAFDGGLAVRMSLRDAAMMGLRMVGEVGSTILYLRALQHMALGDLSAIMQSLPLLVTVAAALVFGEQIGWRRLLAVAVGMAGVLLILRPGTSAFDVWSIVALASVLLVMLRDLATRAMSPDLRSSTIALSAAIGVTLSAWAWPSGEVWRVPTATEAGLTLLAAALLTVGYLSAVAAMRVGDISFVAPFRYASLIVAITLGLIVFGEWPDLWTWAGSALVVGAGVYVIWREARLERGRSPAVVPQGRARGGRRRGC